MSIPRIIHHLWKDEAIPARYLALRETWRRLHPGWELRLWTDKDLLALVEQDYPQLIELYRGYQANICRADLGRYLVLHRFGGVYADLDCECLRPVDPLLDGAGFAIAVEPAAHLAYPGVAERGLSQILCPSFIASEPGHPFWRQAFGDLVAARGLADPLDATGPYMLTRAYEAYPARAQVAVLSAEQIYPIAKDNCWSGRVHDIEFWERATRNAYVLHYWDGTWFRRRDVGWRAAQRVADGAQRPGRAYEASPTTPGR